ncbi:MAG: 2-C-methyl-D-erythritol 4-phosphate cytidylyltransferase [Bacteroidota bacterium]
MKKEKIAAIIPAAGSGARLGVHESKPFLLLGDRPLLIHTLQRFQDCSEVDELILVVRAADLKRAEALVLEYRLGKVVGVVEGGQRRQDSVYRGLKRLDGREVAFVLIHDAVRPFLDPAKVHEIIRATKKHSAAVLAVPPKDTIKLSNGASFVQTTLDRTKLWAVQTPQCFATDLLMKAYESAFKDDFVGTDDASLVERLGVGVSIVEGSYDNIKITTQDDLDLAELILRRQTSGVN